MVPVTFAETVTRGRGLWGKQLVDYLDRYDFLAGIGIDGDCLPAAGAKDTWVAARSAHTIGTCRMGSSPERSVVDPWGHTHDVPNLWICDNSVFPSALAANPALTIMALSLRTADRILGRS